MNKMRILPRTGFTRLLRCGAQPAAAVFFIFHFSSVILSAYSGIPWTGSTGPIKGVYISGTAPPHLNEGDVDFWGGELSSMTWKKSGGFWGRNINLIPGNTYYYNYMLDYGTGSVTTRIWEQSDTDHTIYVGYNDTVFLDGDFSRPVPSTGVPDNWAGAPSPPQSPRVEVGDGTAAITWTPPHFGGLNLLDNMGYLLYLSQDGKTWTNYNGTSTLISPEESSVTLTSLKNNAMYYLKLRSVDKYDYGTIDMNSELYPAAEAGRVFNWDYSQTVMFKPNKPIRCRFALTYPGEGPVSLTVNGSEYHLSKEGNYLTAWVTLTEMETYSYSYSVADSIDPAGARSVRVIDINSDGKFYVFDTWGVTDYSTLPEAVIGWKIAVSTGDVGFLWKTIPGYTDDVAVYYSTDILNWNTVISTTDKSYIWAGAAIGTVYYFAIGDAVTQSSPEEVDTSTPTVSRTPAVMTVSGVVDQNFTAEPHSEEVKITCSAPYKKNGRFSDVYWVIKSTYNRNISVGSEIDWETSDFVTKKQGLSPSQALEFYSDISGNPLDTYYMWNLNIFGSTGVYSSLPDIYVVPAEVESRTGGVFTKSVSAQFPSRSLPVKKAYLRIYNRSEIAVAGKFKDLSSKIDEADSAASGISYQSVLSSSTVFAFGLRRSDGTKMNAPFRRPVTITIPYPPGTDTENLGAFYLDEENGFWKPVKTGPEFVKPTVNTSSGTASFETTHFTVFALMTVAGEKDLSNTAVYPNPYKPYDGVFETGSVYDSGGQYSGIHFARLTSNTKIRIFTIDGVPVKTSLVSAADGTCVWDAKNDSGNEVASGLYLFLAEDPGALGKKKFLGKIAIVR